MKVAICYNRDIRDNGTAYHCRKALEEITDTVYVRSPSNKVPKADLYISIDDGRDDISWIPPKPNAFWAIDTHLGFEFRKWKAEQFDLVYTAQKDAAPKMNAEWLPLACNPQVHKTKEELLRDGVEPDFLDTRWDFSFVGFLNDAKGDGFNNRVDYLDRLFREFPNSWLAMGVFHEEMARRFVRSRIGFNVSIRNDLNMRFFEVLSCGVPLLTNRNVEGINDLFEEGRDYIGYEGMDEMVEMGREALDGILNFSHAWENVRANHTYRNRMERIIEDAGRN